MNQLPKPVCYRRKLNQSFHCKHAFRSYFVSFYGVHRTETFFNYFSTLSSFYPISLCSLLFHFHVSFLVCIVFLLWLRASIGSFCQKVIFSIFTCILSMPSYCIFFCFDFEKRQKSNLYGQY